MFDRDTVIGSVNGCYKRLRDLDPNNELLGYMILLPGSDEPLWNRDHQGEFLEKFGDGTSPRNGITVSTGTMVNYWTTLQDAIKHAEENRLKQDIQRMTIEVNATLAYGTAPLEVKVDSPYAHPP